MSEQDKFRRYIKASEASAQKSKTWEVPTVTSGKVKSDDYTNALRKPEGWVYEPPEPEPEPPKPPTLEEIEAIRQAAYDEGFAEGKDAGFTEGKAEGHIEGKEAGFTEGKAEGVDTGLTEAKEIIDEKVQIWQQLIDCLDEPIRHVDESVEKELLMLVTQLAKAVIKHEVKTNPDILLKTVKEAIDALPVNTQHFEMHLHPDDIAILIESYGEDGIKQKGWRLLPEPALARGCCEIKADTSSVTYTIEQRTSEILDRFLQDSSL
ncbi:flagellar assembly protein FliH [Algibacillus agarilyticus]|uniref:flagellar assembly protein FliH n=1 Tax=Algibacillus agarilyticus TaxID=2234133 RepID=UPI000DCF8BF7|nr:flagellar assembly protein FliH [Algibacillus agarilyticus]